MHSLRWKLQRSAGEQVIAWDGRDDDGSHVRPGTYFAELREGGRTLTSRMVLIATDR